MNLDDQLRQNVHIYFYFMHINVWIHQVRILVVDNYQSCPVPLKGRYTLGNYSKQILT